VQGVVLAGFHSGGGVTAAFFARAFSALSAASFAAAAFVCGKYPDVRSAQKRFFYWVFGLFLALCMVYPLRIATASVFMIIPARSLLRTALYRRN